MRRTRRHRVGEAAARTQTYVHGEVTLASPLRVYAELVDQRGEVVVVDARSRADYEDVHVPGAVHMEDFNVAASRLATSAAAVVAYAEGPGCEPLVKIVDWAQHQGVPVKIVRGGLLAWTALGLPCVEGANAFGTR